MISELMCVHVFFFFQSALHSFLMRLYGVWNQNGTFCPLWLRWKEIKRLLIIFPLEYEILQQPHFIQTPAIDMKDYVVCQDREVKNAV